MSAIWLLIRQYRVFLSFIALEILSIWLLVNNNRYQNAVFFNSANRYVGVMFSISGSVTDYFHLKQVNQELARENRRLRQLLSQQEQKKQFSDIEPVTDPLIINQYNYTLARVVNNSTHRAQNYMTINKGKRHGIEKGMGVISPNGIVGQVSASSEYFSTVISVLHTGISISAQLKKNNELGSLKWDGKSPRYAKLVDIPDYLTVNKGDTIVTSGFNTTYPPKILVGFVEQINKKTTGSESFLNIDVRLATNFNRLTYVYVVKNALKLAKDSLETETYEEINE